MTLRSQKYQAEKPPPPRINTTTAPISQRFQRPRRATRRRRVGAGVSSGASDAAGTEGGAVRVTVLPPGMTTTALQPGQAVSWPPYSMLACISLPQAPQRKRTMAGSIAVAPAPGGVVAAA